MIIPQSKSKPPVPHKDSRLTPIVCLGVIKIRRSGGGGRPIWKCRCECGNIVLTARHRIQNGETKSCGCLRKEMSRNAIKHAQQVRRDKYAAIK